MQTRQFVMLILAATALATTTRAGKPMPDIPVTTYLADYDAVGAAYYVQSDTHGSYSNGAAGVSSILVANGYNHIVNGDWRLDILASTSRTVGTTFETANAVQPGDPGYTAPAEPPYWGTGFQVVRMENKCTMINHNMLAMKAGDTFTCPTIIKLPNGSAWYRLDMAASWTFLNEPETQDVQVSCNSANAAGCNDWFLDPVPVVNADGSTSPGKARARLNLVDSHGGLNNKGDFYLTFHIHVTRP